MTNSSVPLYAGPDLLHLAQSAGTGAPCPTCAALVCPGWESIPGSFDRAGLLRIGTLRRPGDEDPTLKEHHPTGTHAWSVNAPVAPAFFPYNRCDLWQCISCQRPFLRYTEYGGYYQDDRIRALDAALLV